MINSRGRLETPRWRRERRAVWARVITAVAVIALGFSLVKIQVLRAAEFAVIARENMLRPVTVRAPRGTVYDRYGRVVAENRVAYQVILMPAPLDSLRAQIERLRPILGLTDGDVQRAFRVYERDKARPMVVLDDASPAVIARLEERRPSHPTVLIHEYPKRYYPQGQAVAHMIGYVAEISQAELEQDRFADYRQGRWIGKAGLERQYERALGGEPGIRYLEVDARGGIKRWLPEEMGVPPIPGRDLHLYLDLDLQRYAAELLREATDRLGTQSGQAAFVAMDPRTGGVLAMVSYPSYDPNQFTGGIPSDVWNRLREDPDVPLLDRATGAAQPPGSVFKMSMGAMAVATGAITADELMPIACAGGLSYQGRYARCWTTHGIRMNLPLGLKNSCDVYFYQIGIRMGFRNFMEAGTRLGFGEKTGLDLPSEVSSIFPRSTEWFQRRMGYDPPDNEIMSHAIGQGTVTLTPLKVTQMVAGFARPDGKMPVPRLAQLDTAPQFIADYGLDIEEIDAIRQGMRRVVGPGGTAWLSRLGHWDFYGKTGTAQNPHGEDHGWFVGVGAPPGEEPEIVATVLIYGGRHGSDTSAVVANAINFYLNRKHRLPFERYPTARERQGLGLPVDWRLMQAPIQDYPVQGEGDVADYQGITP